MVDITNLKVGDRVKFRRGDINTVTGVHHRKTDGFHKYLCNFGSSEFMYGDNGRGMSSGAEWDLDIMEIIPKKSKVSRRLAKIIDSLPLCETRNVEGVTIKLRDHSTYDVVSVKRPFAHAIQVNFANQNCLGDFGIVCDEDGKSQGSSEYDIVHIRFEPPEEKALRYTEDAIKVTVLEPRGFEQVSGRRDEEMKPTNAIPASLVAAGEYHMSPDGTVTPITTKKETELNKASERAAQSIEFNPPIFMDDHHDQQGVITDDKAVNALDNEIPDDQKGFDPKTAEKGLRYNKGKLRLDLIPPEMIEGVASVLGYGAAKYADRNWEKGMSWMETLASLKRHCLAFEKGEAIDGEGMTEEERKGAGKSGLPHVDHIATNAAFLQTFFARGIGADDRVVLEPKKTVDRNEGNA